MKGVRNVLGCAIALMAVALCRAEPASQALLHEPFIAVLGPPEGVYAEAQVLLPTTLSQITPSRYRFKGQDSWFVLDRPLYLDAFPGEERHYAIECKAGDGSRQAVLSYTIDMRPPEPPVFSQPSGDVRSSFILGVKGSGQIFMSVDGSPFIPFEDGSATTLYSPPDATRTVRALAYCVDVAGNASSYAYGVWRLHPIDMAPSFPMPGPPPRSGIQRIGYAKGDAEDVTILHVPLLDSSRLTIRVPEGSVPCLAVNAADPFGSVASYAQLAYERHGATCIIPYPWGYERDIVVHYGYIKNGTIFVMPEPFTIHPESPSDEGNAAPASPLAPRVSLDDTNAYIEWPPSPWTMLLDSGNGVFTIVNKPIIVSLGQQASTIRYATLGQNGSRSADASMVLPARRKLAEPLLSGVEDGGRYGGRVLVQAKGQAALRYEYSEGDGVPPPVTKDSLSLGQDGLRFDGRAGESVRYRLRVVAIGSSSDQDLCSDGCSERFYSFTIDREAPPVPQTDTGISGYSSSDAIISFKPQGGSVFVSLSESGDDHFLLYEGPITLSGSNDGRKRYVVRAYSEDEFGNRSAEMKPFSILVDISSIYVDARGRLDAQGGPDDPMPFLDDAMAAALALGKHFVYVRGEARLRRPVPVYESITVSGGFDDEWNESPGNTAYIQLDLSNDRAPFAFVVDGGTLNLRSLTFTMHEDSAGGLIYSDMGVISLARVSVRLSGGIEKTAIRSQGGTLSMVSSSLVCVGTLTGRGIDAKGTALSLADSSVSCDGTVRLFDAIRVSDADASLSGLRFDVSPSQALSILSATRAKLSIERSVMSIRGGSSSCRVVSASASDIYADASYIDASWNGSLEVFSAGASSKLRIAHLSVFVDAERSVLVSASASSLDIVNSIAVFSGRDSLFLRSDTELARGSVSSNCLWGFSSLLEGRQGGLSEWALNELNTLAPHGSHNFIEDPSKTFYDSGKGLKRLQGGSACIDRGVPVTWSSGLDIFGNTRHEETPDIGAEER